MRITRGTLGDDRTQDRRPRRPSGIGGVVAVAVVAALALLAGCTRDPDVTVEPMPGGPVEVSDIRLVSVQSCDELVRTAEERAQAQREQLERWEREQMERWDEVGGTVDASATSGAEADAMASAPATTVAPSSAASSESADGAQTRASGGGDVIAGTNNQEQGVDEGDLVVTDGRRLITLTGDGTLRVIELDDSPAIDGSVSLTAPSPGAPYGGTGQTGQLLLRGDEVVAVRATWEPTSGMPVVELARVDVAAPAAPTVVERARVAGELVATRMIDGTVRVVLRPTIGGPVVEPVPVPTVPDTTVPDTTVPTTVPDTTVPDTTVPTSTVPSTTVTSTTAPGSTTTTPPAAAVSEAAARLLPHRLTDDGGSEPLGGCGDVLMPAATSLPGDTGTSTADMGAIGVDDMASTSVMPTTTGVTVLTIGDTLGDLAPVTVEGGAETVYAGTDALYTTASAWDAEGSSTAVHRFDLTGDGPARYTGSGLVPGGVLNQYSLSDRDGALRVVTTTNTAGATPTDGPIGGPAVDIDRPSWAGTAGRITVLRPGDDGGLREVGHLDDLGAGEEVKSVRFIEDRAYVVTFRQTDPLFAVDLTEDTPRLLGELKIPGFSEYLHPVGDDRLLGIGSDADPTTGRVTGFKASLFDVSDPTAPKELDSFVEVGASSSVGQDPKSFNWDPVRSQAIVPVSTGSVFVPAPLPRTEPLPQTTPTTVVCPPDVECSFDGSAGIATDGVVAQSRNEAWIIGVDGDRLVRRGTIAHELGGWAHPILRSVVVDDSIWSVSEWAVGRTSATSPGDTALIGF